MRRAIAGGARTPVVRIARSPAATIAGIAPQNAAAFVVSQVAGALASALLLGWLYREPENMDGSDTAEDRAGAQKCNTTALAERRSRC